MAIPSIATISASAANTSGTPTAMDNSSFEPKVNISIRMGTSTTSPNTPHFSPALNPVPKILSQGTFGG